MVIEIHCTVIVWVKVWCAMWYLVIDSRRYKTACNQMFYESCKLCLYYSTVLFCTCVFLSHWHCIGQSSAVLFVQGSLLIVYLRVISYPWKSWHILYFADLTESPCFVILFEVSLWKLLYCIFLMEAFEFIVNIYQILVCITGRLIANSLNMIFYMMYAYIVFKCIPVFLFSLVSSIYFFCNLVTKLTNCYYL